MFSISFSVIVFGFCLFVVVVVCVRACVRARACVCVCVFTEAVFQELLVPWKDLCFLWTRYLIYYAASRITFSLCVADNLHFTLEIHGGKVRSGDIPIPAQPPSGQTGMGANWGKLGEGLGKQGRFTELIADRLSLFGIDGRNNKSHRLVPMAICLPIGW